ncbi:MAG: succinate dehydrogenase, hydrophobic membrane anchor protein [Armatimonadota bacterium]|nr:succinate dehydrogenase, hydrophobic membrane anchor protein [Armatimonadota bacterium]MDR5702531.1 succinate dehydrogenase, hydrophobic membrane anchor protein [Armatimonadota bacterium]MDR7435808.1 succinate dehydrogenase, hydrophobic membrane anchor protein [Armatimonadota bacterium]
MQVVSRPRPGAGFELYSWLFMRISAILLLLLVLGHLVVMHLINTTENIDFNFVAKRFATPFWRSYDTLMLLLTLLHGLNGVRTIVEDYVHSRPWRVFWTFLLVTVGLVFGTIGALVIFTFQP